MDEYSSLPPSVRHFLLNGGALSVKLREYGCPMMDDTPWVQGESGEVFTSPDGTGTAAFWLPCTLHTVPAVLPGTCADCVLHQLVKAVTEEPN
jgi:hypothetical protein